MKLPYGYILDGQGNTALDENKCEIGLEPLFMEYIEPVETAGHRQVGMEMRM